MKGHASAIIRIDAHVFIPPLPPSLPPSQLTNLMFQSTQLGLTGQWGQIKKAYAAANRLLGDIIKVRVSSFPPSLLPSLPLFLECV